MVSVWRAAMPLAAALVIGLTGAAGRAQGVDCEALRQALAAVTRPDPDRDARFFRAIAQQRSELARTQAYADSVGCGGLHIFDAAPAQCDAIANRIERMQNNLDSLEGQARTLRNGDPERAQDLQARYDGACRTAPDRDLFGDPGLTDDGRMPSDSRMDDGGEPRAQGGDKAICVRTCDGGYFPMATRVRSDDLGGLQALCSAQCPNTEAKLYTTADTDNIAGAVTADGAAYTELPAAFKFTKSHDPACTCKPPNGSWAEALAKAEDLLDKSQANDVTVTEKMSAEMARPSASPPPVPPKKTGKRDRKPAPDLPQPPAANDAVLAAVGAQAPTAGTSSAGIAAAGSRAPAPVVRAGEGAVRTMPGPDGTDRRVRVIGPGL